MSRARAIACMCGWAVAFTAAMAIAQSPPRDRPASLTGRAAIAGVVLSLQDANPIRRARMALVSTDRRVTRTTVTDDAGRFRFVSLPSGRYQLLATKQGFVPTSYGAKRANRPGIEIVIGEGSALTSVTVRMTRASVISGMIVDQNGEPLPGANVAALRNALNASGQRQLVLVSQGMSDDRGEYRIWGLAAGEYVVCAWLGVGIVNLEVEMTRTTDADVKRAVAELTAGATQPGMPQRVAAPPSVDTRVGRIGYAPVYYPGGFMASQAAPIKLGIGEERAAIDLSFQLVATSKIEGSVSIPASVDRRSLQVQLVANGTLGFSPNNVIRTSSQTANGIFAFASVPPGNYTLIARAMPPLRLPAMTTTEYVVPRPTMWATATVMADGQDIDGVELTLQPYLSLGGRVQFEGARHPPDLQSVLVSLVPVPPPDETWMTTITARPDSRGFFELAGIIPGRYRLFASLPIVGGNANPWLLREASIDNREALRSAVDLRDRGNSAVITFTDRVSRLAGTLRDDAGAPSSEYSVIVFSCDRTMWLPQTRAVRLTRPGSDGQYAFANLAPGEYFLAAVDDLEPVELFDPALLEQRARSAMKIVVVEGETNVQDLKVPARVP